MKVSKGFTLIEIVVVIIIVGALLAIATPNFMISMEQSKAQAAQTNLLAIGSAQQKYYEDHGTYYYSLSLNDVSGINSNLSLSISSNDTFQYSCSAVVGVNFLFNCTASDGVDTLTLNPNAQIPSNAVSCYGNANFTKCPVTCSNTKNSNSYCPSNLQ